MADTFSRRLVLVVMAFLPVISSQAQTFYFGADLSYVNEMEDCGVVYRENDDPRDPYQLFADHGANLVRLRLWHTPAWYDDLNSGERYADFQDVKQGALRAKQAGMAVLLDFHLSDNWADPSKQVAPEAWWDVVDDLPVLQDSLYNYVSGVLLALHAEDLLPEMVQIGNETNKGILLSPEVNASGWVLDWDRNGPLFNTAIAAVRDVEAVTGQTIKVALHIAGPSNVTWWMEQFTIHGVTDFDIIGMSYYWPWHQPTTIAGTGDIIAQLRQTYPGKEVMILETACIWTTGYNDNAGNNLNAIHPAYQPPSPGHQLAWLTDLTQEVIDNGGSGVIVWEPAWVSSSCWTQWGQGSHFENAAFFDFDNNLLDNGGIGWMTYPYENLVSLPVRTGLRELRVYPDANHHRLILEGEGWPSEKAVDGVLFDALGRKVLEVQGLTGSDVIALPALPDGVYFFAAYQEAQLIGRQKLWIARR